jgi:hypothetical protein
MRNGAIILSILGILLTVVPSFFVFYGLMTWKLHTQLVFIGMLLWFVFTPLWMKEKKAGSE